MIDTGVLRDMGRQRMIQALAGCIALLGLGLWYYNVTVLSYSVGAFIAAVAIIFFAIATIHLVDDEEVIEKEEKK